MFFVFKNLELLFFLVSTENGAGVNKMTNITYVTTMMSQHIVYRRMNDLHFFCTMQRLCMFDFSPLCVFKCLLKWPDGVDAKSHYTVLHNAEAMHCEEIKSDWNSIIPSVKVIEHPHIVYHALRE